jgi:hypothetical protein
MRFVLMRSAIGAIAVIGMAALAGCGTAGPTAARLGGVGVASGKQGGQAVGQAVSYSPALATMPSHSTVPSRKATSKPSASPGASAGHGGTGSSGVPGSGAGTGSTGSGGSATGGSGTGSSSCASPSFSTSATDGGETVGPYYVLNNMWNAANYPVSQTLSVCSATNWYVTATMNNDSGDGAVKTYPNVQDTFSDSPAISSFGSIDSSFAQSTNPGGIYEYAYDIWINGLATSGSTEVMIWTYNHGQRPSGSQVATVTVGGEGYQVWKNGSYIAFVADQNVNSGTVNLLGFFDYIVSQGWLTSSAKLSQICYGVELVSTSSVPETFAFTNFSVSA